jgi:hypothetical protein
LQDRPPGRRWIVGKHKSTRIKEMEDSISETIGRFPERTRKTLKAFSEHPEFKKALGELAGRPLELPRMWELLLRGMLMIRHERITWNGKYPAVLRDFDKNRRYGELAHKLARHVICVQAALRPVGKGSFEDLVYPYRPKGVLIVDPAKVLVDIAVALLSLADSPPAPGIYDEIPPAARQPSPMVDEFVAIWTALFRKARRGYGMFSIIASWLNAALNRDGADGFTGRKVQEIDRRLEKIRRRRRARKNTSK